MNFQSCLTPYISCDIWKINTTGDVDELLLHRQFAHNAYIHYVYTLLNTTSTGSDEGVKREPIKH